MSTVADARVTLAPPLKWAGGKRWQVPHLRPMWAPHQHRRLVEPFCGGLAVSLGLQPDRALLNDTNSHLISFYRWLQRGLQIDIEMANDKALFYRHRRRFNALLKDGESESAEAACIFYYLNRTGYNGLCRFNKGGEFNVPFGRHKSIRYVRDFSAYADGLAGWELTNLDLASLPIRRDDFVYADPPYDVQFTHYSKGGFSWADQERTAEVLAKHPGPVILVNQATERVTALYEKLKYTLRYLSAPRRINRTGDRRPAREILATRNL